MKTNKKSTGFYKNLILLALFALIIAIYFFLNEKPEDSSKKYIDIYHEVLEGNSVQFKLINNDFDTIDYNNEDHSFFNLEVTSFDESVKYSFNDNKIYPCEAQVKYKFVFDSTHMEGQKLLSLKKYVDVDEFINYNKSDKAVCKETFQIVLVEDPDLDKNCRFFVLTDHPDNLLDSAQIDTINYTYFTKGLNLIEISINGKDGTYLKQNEFSWNSNLTHMNIWARSTQYPNEYVSYINNGMEYEECLVVNNTIIEESENNNNNNSEDNNNNNLPVSYDWKKYKSEQTKIIEGYLIDPFSNMNKFDGYKGCDWKLNGQLIVESTGMILDLEIMDGKTLNIVDLDVSKKVPKVNSVNIKSK